MADAFYAFDEDTNDLYSRRNGMIIGGSVQYIEGYVAYGKAIVLNQLTRTYIQITPGFNFSVLPDLTIEGFFMLQRPQLNATLIQLTPNLAINLRDNILSVSLRSDVVLQGKSVISTDHWHHLSFVYDTNQQTVTLYIDGTIEATSSALLSDNSSSTVNSSIIIGDDYLGCIDQLSISLRAKRQEEILWDATVVSYHPLDLSWLLDSGPNGLNATAANVMPVYGWRYNALSFNTTNAFFQVDYMTALGTAQQAFSISLWVRPEAQAGIFLTISNPSTCLLVLGLQNNLNTLVAYLPNSTTTGDSVNIPGPRMPNAWVNVVFTWSHENRAKLYTSGYLQNANGDVNLLSNTRGGNNSLPMTLTLGKYNGQAHCDGIAGVNTSQEFIGSIDEVYVFARELQSSDIAQLIKELPT